MSFSVQFKKITILNILIQILFAFITSDCLFSIQIQFSKEITISPYFNQAPLVITILLRFKFNQYKDHNILVHLGYQLQIPFVTSILSRFKFVPQRDDSIPAHSSQYQWNHRDFLGATSRVHPLLGRDPKKKELETIAFKWQRDHSFLLDGLLFGPRVRKRKVHGNF